MNGKMEFNKIYKSYCMRCHDYVDALYFHPQNTQYLPFLFCLKCGYKLGNICNAKKQFDK